MCVSVVSSWQLRSTKVSRLEPMPYIDAEGEGKEEEEEEEEEPSIIG